MKLLFVHQNMPGQYRELVQWLSAQGGHEIVFLTQREKHPDIKGVRTVVYKTCLLYTSPSPRDRG